MRAMAEQMGDELTVHNENIDDAIERSSRSTGKVKKTSSRLNDVEV
jgi:hypothetical protein